MKIYALILTILALSMLAFGADTQADEASRGLAATAEETGTATLKAAPKVMNAYNFDNVMGSPDANVEIIEYASMSCIHCANFHKNIFPLLKERYIDTGKVRFRFRDFPLGGPPALYGAMLSHCVPASKYHHFVSALFKTQESWATKKNYIEILASIAKLGKMSREEFDRCMQDKKLIEKIKQGVNEAKERYGVGSTPSFVINGTTYANMNIEKFVSIIEPLLY